MRDRLINQVRRYLIRPPIDRAEMKRLIEEPRTGVTIIETLPAKHFHGGHLPGAINVPNDEHFERAIREAVPDTDRQVIVYCWNSQCQAAYDAARKMELIGYSNVFVYEEGKEAWQEAGGSIESPAGAPP
jgi:rhodanese-related sulfurtransferase